jgi:uncharacterized protein (TIGR03000 family)
MYDVLLLAALTTGSATPDWPGYGGGCDCNGGSFDDGYGGGYIDGGNGYGYWGGSIWGYGDVSHPGTVAPGGYGVTAGTVVPGTGTNGGGYSDGGYGFGYWGDSIWGYGDVSHPGTVAPGSYGVTGGTVVPGTGINGGGYNGGYSNGGYGYGYWGDYNSWGNGDLSHPGTVAPGGYGETGGTVVPGTGTSFKALSKPKPNKTDDKETMGPTHATLVVELPANATLFIDNMPVKATAGVQTFNTPALEPGKAYFYQVRIERSRDGQPVSETRRIIVRAGQVIRADFNNVASEQVTTTQAK